MPMKPCKCKGGKTGTKHAGGPCNCKKKQSARTTYMADMISGRPAGETARRGGTMREMVGA